MRRLWLTRDSVAPWEKIPNVGHFLGLPHFIEVNGKVVQGGSNMTGTDLCVNKPHCAAAVRP